MIIRQRQKIISDDLGQPIVIENRAGANGFIDTEHVARSAPDDYTLLTTSSSIMISGVLVASKAHFDAIRDFTPVALRATKFNLVDPTLYAMPD